MWRPNFTIRPGGKHLDNPDGFGATDEAEFARCWHDHQAADNATKYPRFKRQTDRQTGQHQRCTTLYVLLNAVVAARCSSGVNTKCSV